MNSCAPAIRDLKALSTAALEDLLALNNAHATELSLLTMARFQQLISAAWAAWSNAEHSLLLLAFDQRAAYDGSNYQWFRARYDNFVYIDRIVVAQKARGQGLAGALYASLFAQAAAAGHALVCCEVNLQPPNLASDAFHAKLGFAEAGQAGIPPEKVVRYLTRALAPRC
ncbi:MAG: GNAT family N-acetyltransferase [Rhizomicrobium sp.]|nr:GNAT family N-acetyltransferase [Rhizomicrobium sp.]